MQIKLLIILIILLIGQCSAYMEPNDDDDYLDNDCDPLRRQIYLRNRYIIELERRLKYDRDNNFLKDRGSVSNYDAQAFKYPHEVDEVIIMLQIMHGIIGGREWKFMWVKYEGSTPTPL